MDPTRDESLIFEFLEFKHDVGDDGSAVWFLQDLANEQEAEGDVVNLILTFISLFWFFWIFSHIQKRARACLNFHC